MSQKFIIPGTSELERAVLGCCLISGSALSSVLEILKPSDFSDSDCRLSFEALIDLFNTGTHADMFTFSEALKARGAYERLGGQSFVAALASGVQSSVNAGYYAQTLRDYSIRRRLVEAADTIGRFARDFSKTIPEILEDAENLLFEAGQNKSSSEFWHVREILGPLFVNLEERMHTKESVSSGYSTGFTDLDALTGGLQHGSLTIIAARPSMGKTALAMNIAQFGGRVNNAPVLVFSLEMPREQIVQRMLSAQSGVDLSRITQGLIDTAEFERVREASATLAMQNIYINDGVGMSAVEFRASCKRFKMHNPELALIVVDYLQLMTSGEQPARTVNRVQEVSDISRMLKATAREMDCPVIALSQLSRETEKRPDKKPQLSDLRDSGAIEQDADVVMMLYREDYYSDNENNSLKDSQADIRIAKNRNGSTGVCHLTFKREITRFYNYGEI
ncbi:MAG: replicative DNA helicase [Synergistaceae bacterium]|nr:replicative DNA helicase [Synergistaceae bacterium]